MDEHRMTHQGIKAHTPEGSAGRITPAGLVARSPEGTAAKGMSIKGNEDLWVEIQTNTFKNWINEHLRPVKMRVNNLSEDLQDGTVLCALVETLQGRRLKGWSQHPTNQHHKLENVTTALQAIEDDGVKLVNIGNVDIVNGNLKLILGLIWSLIVRYQIGRSKFPPRKLMLAWLQSALPDCRVGNLTTDWNSGILLSALIDYCKPGLFPRWRELNRLEGKENCTRAMRMANRELGVPMVLEPEYLASPWLDELSGMTYLSYFMKPDSPAFDATLRWVNSILEKPISNFTTDWNDGRVACELVRALGGLAPPANRLKYERTRWEENLQAAIDAAKKLGVQPVLSARDMTQSDVEHLGVMAWVTQFMHLPPKPAVATKLRVALESTSGRVGEPTLIRVESISKDIKVSDVRLSIINPLEEEVRVRMDTRGDAEFVAEHAGMHEIVLTVDDVRIDGRYFFRVLPRLITVPPPKMTPCAVGSIVEVLVNGTGAPRREDIDVTAFSPSGCEIPLREKHPPPAEPGSTSSSATFQPNEPGLWTIAITYQGRDIQGGPFTCEVFDPSGVRLEPGALEGAEPLKPHSFELDTSGCGAKGDLQLDIVHDKRSVMCALEKISSTRYRATFLPKCQGKHRLYIYFNGYDVDGSPYLFRVGDKHKMGHSHRDSVNSPVRVSSPASKFRSASPMSSYNMARETSRNIDTPDNNRTGYYSSESHQDRSHESYKYMSNSRHDSHNIRNGSESPRYRTESPRLRIESPRLRTESPRLRTESPRYRTESPYGRYDKERSSSPYFVTTPTERTSSPAREYLRTSSPMNSPVRTSRKVVEKRSNYMYKESYSGSSDNILNDFSTDGLDKHMDKSLRLNSSGEDKGCKRYESWQSSECTIHETNSVETTSNASERANDDRWNRPMGRERDDKPLPVKPDKYLDVDYDKGRPSTGTPTQVNPGRDTPIRPGKFADFSHDGFNDYLDRMVDEHENEQKRETSQKKPFLSNRPPQATNEGALKESHNTQDNGSLTEPDAAHMRFRKPDLDVKKGAKDIIIEPTLQVQMGNPAEFLIDGSNAGSGDLEIIVENGEGLTVPSTVKKLHRQKYLAAFIPRTTTTHIVTITFNDEPVPGSPWKVKVVSMSNNNISNTTCCTVVGESTRLIAVKTPAIFEVSTVPGSAAFTKHDVGVNVTTPSRRQITAKVQEVPGRSGVYRIEFLPNEVGTHIIDVSIGGEKVQSGPLIAKVYDASLIKVTDIGNAVIGQQCQFRVDASSAGEGQLEISINDGEVPNHVQVVGGGRCLVFWRPELPQSHRVDIKFNGEAVPNSPFIFNVTPAQKVTMDTTQIELIPVDELAVATIRLGVTSGNIGDLSVAVRGPRGDVPVNITGDATSAIKAEFTPRQVGPHTITAHYAGLPVQGTPFICKVYDWRLVNVTGANAESWRVGSPCSLSVDAAHAGEGNLEITVSARGLNIPTQVHPQGNARFTVTFTPTEACDHVINVTFNKMRVPGCPLNINVSDGGGARVTLAGPAAINKPASLTLHHPTASLDQVEVNVEGSNGASVPATVSASGPGNFKAEFVPRAVGEHRINVAVNGIPLPASPFHVKVYDVTAIRVKDVSNGTVGKPVTFLVETMSAGPGNLEVTVNGGRVPTAAAAQGAHTYAISFTPREPRPHTVELRFNGDHVPGSPFTCHISAPARVIGAGSGESPDKVSVGDTYSFSVDAPSSPLVEVLGPARRAVPVEVSCEDTATQNEGSKRFFIQFSPVDVGDHSIEVRNGASGGHVEGSPFLVKAYSASRVQVTDIAAGVVGRPLSFTINASQAGAGNLEIIVAVNGRNVPNYVQSEGNARFKVNFKPVEAAPHVLSVKFNGQPVPGSPFSCMIHAPPASPTSTHAIATGPGLTSVPRSQPAEIQITGCRNGEPTVNVIGPGGTSPRVRVSAGGSNGDYTAHYTPTIVGRHSVHITVDGRAVNGSPFSCNVYDVQRVRVTGLGATDVDGAMENLTLEDDEIEDCSVEVGKPVTFSVDASSAGEGTLELVVATNTTTVKAEVVAVARGLYDVTFVPVSREPHRVSVTFNEKAVPGSPFVCNVAEPHTYVHVGSCAVIEIEDPVLSDIEITSPSGTRVTDIRKEGATAISFPVNNVGRYTVSGSRGTIAEVEGFNTNAVKVLSIGEAYCHRPSIITVSTLEGGGGRLSARVWCGSHSVPHSVRVRGAGRCELVWHPTRAAPHRISLLWCGTPVSRQPIIVDVLPPTHGNQVTALGLGLYQSAVGKVTSFSIDTLGRPAREFDVVVSGPGSKALPVRCYQTKSGLLQAEYTINEIGQSTIEVLHLSKPVSGSPFTCESFDPTKVVMTGLPTGNIISGTPINFTADHSSAGEAELEVVCEGVGSSAVRVPLTIRQERNSHRVRLTPPAPGHYRLYINYGGFPVADSPVSLGVVSASSANIARAVGTGLSAAHVGKEAAFTIHCSDDLPPLVEVERLTEDGEVADSGLLECRVTPAGSREWRCAYIPLVVGLYEVRVASQMDGPLHGSPFAIKVIDTSAIIPVGGWGTDANGRVRAPTKLVLDTSRAGPGQLECLLAGRHQHVESVNGRAVVTLGGSGSGEVELELTYNGALVGEAPRRALIAAAAHDRVALSGRGLAHAQPHVPAHFTIDGTNAGQGSPDATLTSADGNNVEVKLTPTGPSLWRATYTPHKPGTHQLRVNWAGRLIKGCPLSVNVSTTGGSGGATNGISIGDASRVVCSGAGLSAGVLGKEIRSWIDTRRAGPGELAAHCTGPNKVAYCELYEHGDGTFTLNVKPQEAGKHTLSIQYAGQNVPGSPFTLRVAGAPDPSKVRVYGPGVEPGVLATFQSRFLCDTRGAGAGQLTVRVRGPKGAFRVEMQRESQKDRTILCKFSPTEPGDYRVEVRWAGKHVPGSPFPVMIFDTQEELRRYIQALST